MPYNFGPAYRDEGIVFGASRPGYGGENVSPAEVQEWIRFMRDQGIERVVCLLPPSQLSCYREDLLKSYCETFGSDNVRHAPIKDFHLSTPENLQCVLGFLEETKTLGRRVVVHCSGGSGRTGHVLAAWLVHARGLDPYAAIKAVERAAPPRCPREAVNAGNATEDELIGLLSGARPARGG